MASQTIQLEARQGAYLSATLTIGLASGAAGSTYTDAAPLACRAWPGGSYATTFTPTVAWVDASAGTITLTIPDGLTTSVDPGLYELELAITGNSGTTTRPFGAIRVTPAPGSDAPPRTYCTLKDMTDLAPWIERVEDLDTGLSAGIATNFLNARADARTWIDKQAMARARRAILGQQRMRGPAWLTGAFAPADATLALDNGAYFGASAYPDTDVEADLQVIRDALADGELLTAEGTVGEDVPRIAAAYALYLALRHLGGKRPDGTTYRDLATEFRREATAMLRGTSLGVDVDSDGVIGDGDFLLSY